MFSKTLNEIPSRTHTHNIPITSTKPTIVHDYGKLVKPKRCAPKIARATLRAILITVAVSYDMLF